MATATVSIASTVTPGTTLSNPVSLDELQALGTPTVAVASTASITNVVGTEEGKTVIVEAPAISDSETNGAALVAALATAKTLGGTATHPATVLLMPGNYFLNGSTLTIDDDYVHISGATGNPYDVVIDNDGATSSVTYNGSGVHITGVYLKSAIITDSTAGAKTDIVFRNCVIDNAAGACLVASATYYADFIECHLANVGRSSNQSIISGTIDRCTLAGSNTLHIAAAAIVRNSTIEVTLDGASAINADIYHCALKAALGGNITNDIGTPYNVVDPDVAV